MQALWMALGALFFSIMGVCIKLASPYYGTMEILFYRGFAGILIFSVLMRLQNVSCATPVIGLHIKRSMAGVTAMALWFYGIAHLRPLHNLADHPAEARIMLILSRFA